MRGRKGWSVVGGVLAFGCTTLPARERESEAVVTLLHTSDLHSRVWPFRARISPFEAELGLGEAESLVELGGFARLATLVQREPKAVWIDSGDALEGAEIFHRFAGEVEVRLLSELGLTAQALGNHELSLDAASLARLADQSSFPLLACNVRPQPGSPLAGRLVSGALVAKQGPWIGVIGVANPTSPPALMDPENRWQLEVASDTATAVQACIDELSGRAQLVVVASHLGLDGDRELVRGTSGIDLVLGGHQHIVTSEPEWEQDCAAARLVAERGCEPRRVPIVHSGTYGKWLSVLRLSLAASEAFGLEVRDLRLSREASSERVPESAVVLEELSRLELPPTPPLAFAPAGASRKAALSGDAPLGNLVTDALLRGAESEVVLLNSSGLRADLEPGLVLRSDLELVFPFAERWRRGLVPAEVLRRGLERAARRSAARECQSVLQVAGLRLQVSCAQCAGGSSRCLQVERTTPVRELAGGELVKVLLPEYIATRGTDFEELLAFTEGVELDVGEVLAHEWSRRSKGGEDDCEVAALELSPASCRAALGEVGCPVSVAGASALCRELPRVEGKRDDRIQMLR